MTCRSRKRSFASNALAAFLCAAPIAFSAAPSQSFAEETEADPFAFFLLEPLPKSIQQTQDYNGWVDLGLGYINADNQQFGRYSGLYDEGWYLDLNLDYLSWASDEKGTNYIGFSAQDLGLETRSANIELGRLLDYRFEFMYDQQYQYNGTALTPFTTTGSRRLLLPAGWVSGANTSDMSGLANLDNYDLEQKREILALRFKKRFDEMWSFDSRFQNEDRTGTDTLGAAHYLDGSNGHAVLLPAPVDYNEQQLDLSAHMRGKKGSVELRYHFSQFENSKDFLIWQNPYDAGFGVDVDYPNGEGMMGLAPSNDLHQFRVLGQYLFSDRLRGLVDASYSLASQNEDYLPYTVNSNLLVAESQPRSSLDGEVVTTTLNARVFHRTSQRLTLRGTYQYEDRDNTSPRDGYLYVRGDSADQPESKFTLYNRPTSRTRNTFGLEANYRFQGRGRLIASYQYEEVARHNAAVEKTKEDRVKVAVNAHGTTGASARFDVTYGERRASTYNWDQSYYALLDAELINETPATQRYNNHPQLSQYYLADRDQLQVKMNIALGSDNLWQHNLDVAWNYDDYDVHNETTLGLERSEYTNLTFSSSYFGSEDVTLTGYYALGLNRYKQRGRAFLGGLEKNAFVVVPPYPQASDPERDWVTRATDWSHALGVNTQWVVVKDKLDYELDFQFVDTASEQDFSTYGADDLYGVDLPDNASRVHHITFSANYQINKEMSAAFQYQYYRYDVDDWAVDAVDVDTVDKVLWSGDSSANDIVNVFALSVRYHLP